MTKTNAKSVAVVATSNEVANMSEQDKAMQIVEAAVTASINSSQAHAPILKMGAAAAIAFAAAYGRVEPLNRLYDGVSHGDAEIIRLFIVNLTTHFGGKMMIDNAGRPVCFLGYRKNATKDAAKGWYVISKKTTSDTQVLEAAREMGERISKMGADGVLNATYKKDGVEKIVPFGPAIDRGTSAGNTFDDVARLKGFIKAAITNRSALDIRTINNVIPAKDRFKESEIQELERKAEQKKQADLEAAQKLLDEQNKQSEETPAEQVAA